MITPAPSDLDWYVVDDAKIITQLQGVPAIRVRRNKWQIHRSHLPLLTNVIEALRALEPHPVDLAARDRRDRATELQGYKLRWYQHDAVDFIRARRGTLLADDMRVGKTLSALASYQPDEGPLLIVCPLIAREVWRRWIDTLYPGEDVGVLVGKEFDPELAKKPIVLCHYDILASWQSPRKWGMAIFDEAHVLSASHRSRAPSKRGAAAGLHASWAHRVVAATGTPVWNRPIGLWGILALLAPYAFGSRYEFGQRYCDPKSTAHGFTYLGATNSEELTARLNAIRIRREWKDVQANLPAISRSLAVADLTNAQHRAIDIAAGEIVAGAATTARLRRALGAAKVKPTIEAAEKVLGTGAPVVIWTWHQDVAKKIAAGLEGAVLIDGSTLQKKREEIFESWRQGAIALVMTMATGQVGIDLSHAREAIFAEPDWTPAIMRQAEMRTFSPLRPMHVLYVVSDHPVERRMVMALHEKLSSATPIGADVGRDAIDILLTALNLDTQQADMQRLITALLENEFTEG